MGPSSSPDEYEELPECELHLRYHQHDDRAYQELWKRRQNVFQEQALRWAGGDPDLSAQSCTDLWLRLREKRVQEGYDPCRSWQPWASTILLHIVTDHHRRRARERVEFHSPAAFSQVPDPDRKSEEEAREEASSHEARIAAWKQCLHFLRNYFPNYWVAVVHAYLFSLSLRESAERLGTTPSAINNWRDRGRKQLEKCRGLHTMKEANND